MSDEFRWNPNSQRYQRVIDGKLGSFVSRRDVEALTSATIGQYQTRITAIADQLVSGSLSIGQWEKQTAQLLKKITIAQYSIGIGGVGRLSTRDYGIIGNHLKQQYRYLRMFSIDLRNGKLSEAQFRSRLVMYVEKTHGAYERGRNEGHKANGYKYERRFLHSSHSCSDCPGYAALGWQPIGSLPNPTEKCECRSRCKCSKSYSLDMPKDSYINLSDKFMDIKDEILVKRDGDRLVYFDEENDSWKDFVVVPVTVPKGGIPTADQLKKINQYVPSGFPALTADDVIVVSGIAADNLINRSYSKWGVDDLKAMAKLLVGKPTLFDHNSYDVQQQTWGRVFDAQFVNSLTAENELIDAIAQGVYNRKIIATEGFNQVFFQAYLVKSDETLGLISSGRASELSTGGFRFTDFWCPVCDTSIRNPKCPHYVRSPWSDSDDPEYAPYVERRGLFDLMEISLVSTPNIPGARLI